MRLKRLFNVQIYFPIAKQDIKDAAKWYNNQKTGLGKELSAAVRKKVRFIRQNPKAVAVRYEDTRTALLDTFPYLVHFAVDDSKN